MLLGADGHGGKLAIGQCDRRYLERWNEQAVDCAAWRNQGASDTLATPCPVMRMITSALRALLVKRCVAVDWEGTVLALATVRTVCAAATAAAAHRQVNYQRRDTQDARKCAHTTPCSLLFVIGDQVWRSLESPAVRNQPNCCVHRSIRPESRTRVARTESTGQRGDPVESQTEVSY